MALMAGFVGEGGSMDNPESVFCNLAHPNTIPMTSRTGGNRRRTLGEKCLQSGESVTFIVLHGISEADDSANYWKEKYGTAAKTDFWLAETLAFWQKTVNAVSFSTADPDFDNWSKMGGFSAQMPAGLRKFLFARLGYAGAGVDGETSGRICFPSFSSIGRAREEILNNFRAYV